MRHGWPVIVWANAGSEQGIIGALDELAAEAGLRKPGDDPTDAARAGLRWLSRHAGPCLLVYDNAVDPDRQVGNRWLQRALLAEYSDHAQSLLAHADSTAAEAVVLLQGDLLVLLIEAHSYNVI